MMQHWWMHFPLCPWGWRQGVAPAIALRIPGTWRGNPAFVIVTLSVAVPIAIVVAISVVIADSVTISVDVAHRRCRRPLPLRLLSTIAAVVSVALTSVITIAIAIALAIGHCHLHFRRPSQLPSPLAITVIVAVGHFQELLPWCGEICIWPIEAKNAYLILLCSDSGRRTDQSQMTDQVSSGNGQHQHWTASGKYQRKWLVREVTGSRGAAGGQQGGDVDWPWEVFFVVLLGYQPLTDGVCDDVLDVVEGIADETVIKLTQEEKGIKEIYDSEKKMYT
jgi:hypothetical protein